MYAEQTIHKVLFSLKNNNKKNWMWYATILLSALGLTSVLF